MNKWLCNNMSIIVFFGLLIIAGVLQKIFFGSMHLIGFALIGGAVVLAFAVLTKLVTYTCYLCDSIAEIILDALDIKED